MTNPATAQILQRVSTLPPLPAAIGRLLRLVNDPDVDFQEIARTISLDQTLTAQLLRIANSAFYGFSQQIRTVQQATVILGRYAVRNMALSLAMATLRGRMKTDWPLTPEVFWRHSMGVACAARLLAKQLRGADAEEAFVAGLLHDIGKIVLMEHDPRVYRQLLQEVERGIRPLHVLEREAFGIDHGEVGRALCHHWNIPDTLAAAVAAHHGAFTDETLPPEARPLTELVHTANALAKLAWIGDGGNPLVAAFWRTGPLTVSVPVERLRQVLEALPGEVARNEQLFFQSSQPVSEEGLFVGDAAFVVQVQVSEPEQRELVTLTLDVLRTRHTTEVNPDPAPSVALLDAAAPTALRERCSQRGIPILDYSQWRSQHAPSDWINVQQLQNWLIQNFSALVFAL